MNENLVGQGAAGRSAWEAAASEQLAPPHVQQHAIEEGEAPAAARAVGRAALSSGAQGCRRSTARVPRWSCRAAGRGARAGGQYAWQPCTHSTNAMALMAQNLSTLVVRKGGITRFSPRMPAGTAGQGWGGAEAWRAAAAWRPGAGNPSAAAAQPATAAAPAAAAHLP